MDVTSCAAVFEKHCWWIGFYTIVLHYSHLFTIHCNYWSGDSNNLLGISVHLLVWLKQKTTDVVSLVGTSSQDGGVLWLDQVVLSADATRFAHGLVLKVKGKSYNPAGLSWFFHIFKLSYTSIWGYPLSSTSDQRVDITAKPHFFLRKSAPRLGWGCCNLVANWEDWTGRRRAAEGEHHWFQRRFRNPG